MATRKFKHIILISLDTLRADCIHASPRAYQFTKKYQVKSTLQTAVLDNLLRAGRYFNNCISAAPYTSASHASYFTGLWPRRHGVYEFFNRPISQPTIFEYAKQRHYQTIFQTDFPIILGRYLGFTKGVDDYFVENEQRALAALLHSCHGNTLSFFHFGGLHYPYGFHSLKFGGEDYQKKVFDLQKKHRIKLTSAVDDTLNESFRPAADQDLLRQYKRIIEELYRRGKYRELFSLYLEGINYFFKNRFDKFLTAIRAFADRHGALLVIFSDHGEAWDQHAYGHHNSLSDEVLRVPLLFYGPGIRPGIADELVRTIDLAPTILDVLTGVKFRGHLDGQTLGIFRPAAKKKRTVYAFAQTWLVGDKRKLSDHQQKVLRRKHLTKPLKTFLSCETVYHQQHKLLRWYDRTQNVTADQLLVRAQHGYTATINAEMKRLLSRQLAAYNKITGRRPRRRPKVPLEIKRGLCDLGYRI